VQRCSVVIQLRTRAISRHTLLHFHAAASRQLAFNKRTR
jgi:hypothetical protein